MDDDPWYWTVQQVADFFDRQASYCIEDMPNARLPDLPSFLQTLADNDVSGAILLTAVDAGFLRTDCGISSLGVRSTVIHCICKLRVQSTVYAGESEIQNRRHSTNRVLPIHAPAHGGEIRQSESVPSQPAHSGQNLRDGEQQVQDAHGRKRRRLDLAEPEPNQPKTVPEPTVTLNGYLRDSAIPVDEVFFGETLFGHQMGDINPDSTILVLEDDRDRAEDNFQFQIQPKSCGERDYVWSQMRHFLNYESVTETKRRGRPALAVLPYREELVAQNKPRSAIVFQIHDDIGTAIALRENAAFVDGDYNYTELAQISPSTEWDFLLANHKGSEELPAYQGSVEEDITSSLADELEAEEEEREREMQGTLTKPQVSDVVDAALLDFVDDWKQGKLPRLESKHAWRIWKQTKRSKALRDVLIEDATAKIVNLNKRIEKYKANFCLDEWRSERDLRATCEIMRLTVEDREEYNWKRDVWARRKQPAHQRDHRKSTTIKLSKRPSVPAFYPSDVEADLSTVDDENPPASLSFRSNDRLSFSPPSEVSQHFSAVSHDKDFPSSPPSNEGGNHSDGEGAPQTAKVFSSDLEDLPPASSLRPKLPKLKLSLKKSPLTPLQNQGLVTEPIDLTAISSDASSPLRKFTNRSRTPADYSSNPYEASASQVRRWDMNELVKRTDRVRLLIKLVNLAGPEVREALYACYRELRRHLFREALIDTLRNMSNDNGLSSVDPVSASVHVPDRRAAMKKLAEIAVAWLLCDPEVIKRPLDTSEWARVLRGEPQFDGFVDQTATILRHRDGKLFRTPKKKPSIVPIVLTSDDEPDNVSPHMTPHKKRKRPVEINQVSKEARTQALRRQEKFRSAMESQASNSQQLAAMVETSTSKSEIVINVTRTEDRDHIYVLPKIAMKIKAHQIDGIRFMWREITNEGKNDAQGCILAHTMGLGKTMQTIALLAAVNEAALSPHVNIRKQLPLQLRPRGIREVRQLRMLILSPAMLLQNWRQEINAWASEALGNVFVVESALSIQQRMAELDTWHRLGGILLISYELFRAFVQQTSVKPEVRERLDEMLLNDPELVVADELHMLKNDASKMSRAASRIRTHSRIGLTGTPMSNDLQEIYALISFVAPGYLGGPTEFKAQITEPIKQGTYNDSSAYEIRKSRKKLEVLRSEIEPKVNRANIQVLKGSLPPMVEFVITLPLTTTQRSVYDHVIDALTEADRETKANRMAIFGWLSVLTVLTNHPFAFRRRLLMSPRNQPKKSKSREDRAGLEDDGLSHVISEANVALNETADAILNLEESEDDLGSDLIFAEATVQALTAMIPDDIDPSLSAKTSLFFDILDLSQRCGDKVLVFSSSLLTLDYLSTLLERSTIPFTRIDGRVQTGRRLSIVNKFHESATSVMLISTRAGSTGLNIQAANRVVIFDFGFNPAWEEQAVGRVYRLGQTKPVYVYRFVTGGTFERQIYDTQLFKQGLTLRVVDKKNPRRNVNRDVREFVYKPKDVEQEDLTRWIGKDPHVLDQILRRQEPSQPLIRALSTMETLQEDAGDMPLDEEDWRDINEDREVRANWRNQGRGGGAGGGQIAAVTGGLSTTNTNFTPSGPSASAPLPAQPAAGVPHPLASAPTQPLRTTGHQDRRPFHDGLPTI